MRTPPPPRPAQPRVRRRLASAAALAVLAVCTLPATALAGSLKNPIDPTQQTDLAFGERSHWLQPWRGYLDTPPALSLRNAIGINFNVTPEEAPATARLLARSGFARARVEIGWDQIDFDDPGRLHDPTRLRRYLGALGANGIRPLILLNANHGVPGPVRSFDATLLSAARRGDRQVLLDVDSARAVVPHKTGLNGGSPYRTADVLFTSVRPDGWATLSRPLPRDLAAGKHAAATLRYAPFGPPILADGRPNPLFEETLDGWLGYVTAVTREAKAVLGSEAFDVEVWNELTFGSDFLYQERYYDPPRESGGGDVTKRILEATVRHLRNPAGGVSRIGIGNGFSSQRPWESGASSPAGLTAIAKHPYYNMKRFPGDAISNGVTPLDALGRPDARAAGAPVMDSFIPRYDAFFPEYILSGIQTEHLVRDVSPLTTDVYRVPHGRRTRPAGGGPAPGVWITEANLDPTGADPARARLTDADVEHLQAKAALRYYTAYANKGVSAIHLFGAKGADLGLIEQRFFDAVRGSAGAYPGDDAGETPRAVARLSATLAGARPVRRPRPLSLLAISDRHDHRQFDGDGSAAHPPLYDRDVVGFFPFQVKRGEYVASVCVMTRNLAKLYRPGAPETDRTRYDLPPARFTLSIGGLGTSRVRASAVDPLTGAAVPIRVRRRGRGRIAVEMPLTDSPRMLRLVERRMPSAMSSPARRSR